MCGWRYDRARILLDRHTRTATTPGWDLHQLRHSAATHLGEANTGLQLAMAKGRWRNPRTAMRYVRPGGEAIAEVRAAGLEDVRLIAVEGVAGWATAEVESALRDPHRREMVLGLLAAVEEEPSLVGASAHLLTISIRP